MEYSLYLGKFTAIGLQLFILFISQLKKDRFGTWHGRMYKHGYMLRNVVMQDGSFMWVADMRLVITENHSSSERSERFVRFEPNVRSERVRYFSQRETNVQALKRLINLIAVK